MSDQSGTRRLPIVNGRASVRPLLAAILVIMLLLSFVPSAEATAGQNELVPKPIMTMRMKLLSIRNRSSGPIPVHITIKYNQPQFLEGDLELAIYDALEQISSEDLIATIRHEGIVLVGQDYEFNMLLPPMRTAAIQNWAIVAAFIKKDGERILLSSVLNSVNQEPYDLLVTSPLERGTLVCSCAGDPATTRASANRKFLDNALSLDTYNPLSQADETEVVVAPTDTPTRGIKRDNAGRTIIHFAAEWAAKDLPPDPLSFCAFDVVTLSDGALARLDEQQLAGLTKWVRAGGSVCILPDAPMKGTHLNFLRTLFKNGLTAEADLSLTPEGKLLVVSDQNDPVVFSHFGYGRAALLPVVDSLQERLGKADLGSVVAFLWKVRKASSIWQGEPWVRLSLLEKLRTAGIPAEEDANGVYVDEGVFNRFYRNSPDVRMTAINGRFYLRPETSVNGTLDLLNPRTEPLLAFAEQALLPSDVEMVPTWVIGLILTGYVLTIGPIDYFVLGWLRLRKYTWVMFPIVTLLFTALTIVMANAYMGSEDTGGRLVITDLIEDGIAARQTILETLFFGAQAEVNTEHESQLVVQAEDSFTQADWESVYGVKNERKPDAPLSYQGRFPEKYSVKQQVQQWSPVSLRTISLEPTGIKPPSIDWNDASLLTSAEGNRRLRNDLLRDASTPKLQVAAEVYHAGTSLNLMTGTEATANHNAKQQPDFFNFGERFSQTRETAFSQLLSYLPTMKSADQGFFRLVSQVAPEGAGSLEDLAFVDAADPAQWGLAIMLYDGKEFQVFRKLYFVNEAQQ